MFQRMVDQALVVSAVLIGSLIALGDGVAWAAWMAGAAGVVLVGLAMAGALAAQRKRVAALMLIAAGYEHLPIDAVQRQCRRLLAHDTRRALTSFVAEMLRDASRRRAPVRGIRPLYDTRVVRAVSLELQELIDHLRADEATPRALALTQLLISDGTSALYGHEAEPLREQLRRIKDSAAPRSA
jgi:hypothetical protein